MTADYIPPPKRPPWFAGDKRAKTAAAQAPDGLVTTIRWHRPAERMPAYGLTVVVWIEMLGVTMRAHRCACGGGEPDAWYLNGPTGPALKLGCVTAWTDVPNGPLPPPDGGAA